LSDEPSLNGPRARRFKVKAGGYCPTGNELKEHVSGRLDPSVGNDLTKTPVPKISIVMPCFNHGKYIERSLLSILNQNYPNVEIIVVDGGSSDETLKILEFYRSEIDILITGPDKGQSDALNKGFSQTTGDVLGWLNSDDLYAPGALLRAAQAFQSNPQAMIVHGDWLTVDESDCVITRCIGFEANQQHLKYEGFCMNAQAMFWRADVHRRFSGFEIGLYNTMDYQMMIEFGEKWPASCFTRVDDVLGCFRRYAGQKTGAQDRTRVERELREIASAYGFMDKYSVTGIALRKFYRIRRAWKYMNRVGALETLRIVLRND
jgi:glycosyltransferase involved in cell wall biosynthesis